ncbi:MAG: sulfurtransferase [Pseudomonadota bacterium]
MKAPLLPILIDPAELIDKLSDPRLLIIDLSYRGAYDKGHVPGAIRMVYPSILNAHDNSDCDIPSNEVLSHALSVIGLTPEHHVVAYDGQGNPMASRLFWTLEEMGHTGVSVINGGWAAWKSEGLPAEQKCSVPQPSNYQARRTGKALATKEYILSKIGDPNTVFLDSRTPEEFANELIITDRGGKIPGAVHFDWLNAVDEENGMRLRPKEDILRVLHRLGATPDKEIIPYCQTHMRSAHTYFVLKYLGYKNILGYAAGYSEWGNDTDTPIENEQKAA